MIVTKIMAFPLNLLFHRKVISLGRFQTLIFVRFSIEKCFIKTNRLQIIRKWNDRDI